MKKILFVCLGRSEVSKRLVAVHSIDGGKSVQ